MISNILLFSDNDHIDKFKYKIYYLMVFNIHTISIQYETNFKCKVPKSE